MTFIRARITLTFLSLILAAAFLVASPQVIQTQESDKWDGIEADITSLTVRNSIVTLRFRIRNTSDERQSVGVYFQECYLMDEVNQKKYYVLKDADGNYIAGPVRYNRSGGYFQQEIDPGKSRGMWMKFPEPADSPETITISVPGFFPFEEVSLGF
jgi:hypothetical protein